MHHLKRDKDGSNTHNTKCPTFATNTSQSMVVFLNESEVQDDWQEEEPLLWRKKGCEVAGEVSQ